MEYLFNPFVPSAPYLEPRQTVQTQIRCVWSESTLFANRFLLKIKKKWKKYTRHPLNETWTHPINKDGIVR